MYNESLISEFSRIAVQIDQAEQTAGDRIGGPTTEETAAIARLERSLPPPAGASDWEWMARRLARAIRHDWRPAAAENVVTLAS